MSGIAGRIHAAEPASPELVAQMADALTFSDRSHRECWHDGTIALCRVHHEVTNPEPQPLFSADGNHGIALFGELFDTEARRARLEQSGGPLRHPDNDAEFALRLYLERGRDAFAELNGSFGFALVDRAARELLLVSDRFSSRPLYYALTPGGSLVFATQVSALLQAPDVPREYEERSILEFLNFQRVFGTRTLHRAVRVLPPGHVLHFRDGGIVLTPYWEMDYRVEKGSEADYVHAMAEAMRVAADRVTRDGSRMGVLLSAGLDSRMVLASCQRDLTCYHFNDSKNHEWVMAEALAQARGVPVHYIQRSPDHYVDLYDDSVDLAAGMYSFNYAHTIGLFGGVRDECDFLLHGFAPELYFRGTNLPKAKRTLFGKKYKSVVDWDLTPENLVDKMLWKLKYSLYEKNPKQMFRPAWAARLDDALRAGLEEMVEEARAHSDDPYDAYLWPDTFYHSKFPSFLFESSIRPYVGERSTVFDNDVLDLHLRMPLALRSDSRVWIRAVRELNPAVAAVADANTGYSPFMPSSAVVGLKGAHWALRQLRVIRPPPRPSGYATISWPRFQEIIRTHPGLQGLIERTVNDPACLDPEIFDLPRIRAMFEEHKGKVVDHRHFLFLLITLGGWNRKYGPGAAA